MGTRFVASVESPVHDGYKNAIVAADATGTWVLNTKSTPCIRALKTDFTKTIHEAGLMPPDTFKGIRGVYFGGDMNAAPALAGQSAGLIHGVLSVQQIIEQTVAEFHAITARLGAMAAAAHFG
jgi:enoyl-[acyl-carrier protein] reductase II